MKANEFVRNKGFKTAKLITDCWVDYPETDVYLPDMMEYTFIAIEPTENCPFVSLRDLKRLIESYELVGNFGGIKRAKRILKKSYKSFNTMVSVVWNDKPFQCTIEKLEQAIADVESCMEVNGGN